MMIIEMRQAAQEKAFELLDEIKDLGRQKKMVLCELEDTLYDCFDDSKEEDKEEMEQEVSDEGTDLGFKDKYIRHYAMRHFDDDDDTKEHLMRRYRRRALRMRRRRDSMGRFA